MGKKKSKGGLSRKQVQRMTKLTRLRRLNGIPEIPKPVLVSFVPTEDGVGVKAVISYGEKGKNPAPVPKRRELGLLIRKYVRQKEKPATIAANIVAESSREVLATLDVKQFDVTVAPEFVHIVGKLVAERAISKAHEYAVAGSKGGGERLRAARIIDSIGRTGLDVEVSPSGEVSTTVTPQPTRKRSVKKVSSSSNTKASTTTGVSSQKGDVTKLEVGRKSVVKRKDGSTFIHIENLNVYIEVNHVDDMIVSQQTTFAKVEGHKEEIAKAVLKKVPDEVIDEEEDDENKKKKKKGDGKKKDEK